MKAVVPLLSTRSSPLSAGSLLVDGCSGSAVTRLRLCDYQADTNPMTERDLEQPGTDVNDAALLRRIADTVAIMLYEMAVLPDGTFQCHEFVDSRA